MKPLFYQFSDTTFDELGHLKEFKLHYPENFNFAYDVVDAVYPDDVHPSVCSFFLLLI